jgi:hypothetical protein
MLVALQRRLGAGDMHGRRASDCWKLLTAAQWRQDVCSSFHYSQSNVGADLFSAPPVSLPHYLSLYSLCYREHDTYRGQTGLVTRLSHDSREERLQGTYNQSHIAGAPRVVSSTWRSNIRIRIHTPQWVKQSSTMELSCLY